jgi:signal transduction histidine kinase
LIQEEQKLIKYLWEINSKISSLDSVESLVDGVSEIMDELLNVKYTAIYLWDDVAKKLKLYRAKGFTEEDSKHAAESVMERHPGWVFTNKKMFHVPDTSLDDGVISKTGKRSFVVRSRLFVPVLDMEKSLGTIGFASVHPNNFTIKHINVLTFIANITGVVYSNILYKRAEQEHQKRLEKALNQLSQLNDSLEVKVKERTKELNRNKIRLEKSLLQEKQQTLELLTSEKKLKISLLKEKELGKLKSSFVSTASHQFRTPLTVIQSNAELLLMLVSKIDNQELEKYKKVTGRITGEIAKMTGMMDDVLVLGKLTSGNVHYNPQELDLVEFCKAIIKQFNLIQEDGRILEFEIVGEPCSVTLDSKLLGHSLNNLICNAFKYSVGKNNPELIVSFKSTELVISIKDYGIGIPEVELPQLFSPFFRAGNAINIQGTGLGLNIAKEYVEVTKGQISAKSKLGEGSCFEITFKR